jgi:SPX domain protein involved in polyphosphate accumulation
MVQSDEDGDQLVGKDPLQQQEYLCATQSSNEVSRFPFAVLQIKLPHDFGTFEDVKTSSLPWLNQLLSCPLVRSHSCHSSFYI